VVDIPWDQVWVAIVMGLEAVFKAALRGVTEIGKAMAGAVLFMGILGWGFGGWAIAILLFEHYGSPWWASLVGFLWLATWGYIVAIDD